jgi:hypothetical protein
MDDLSVTDEHTPVENFNNAGFPVDHLIADKDVIGSWRSTETGWGDCIILLSPEWACSRAFPASLSLKIVELGLAMDVGIRRQTLLVFRTQSYLVRTRLLAKLLPTVQRSAAIAIHYT